MGKLTMSMAIFNSYVSLPEGTDDDDGDDDVPHIFSHDFLVFWKIEAEKAWVLLAIPVHGHIIWIHQAFGKLRIEVLAMWHFSLVRHARRVCYELRGLEIIHFVPWFCHSNIFKL